MQCTSRLLDFSVSSAVLVLKCSSFWDFCFECFYEPYLAARVGRLDYRDLGESPIPAIWRSMQEFEKQKPDRQIRSLLTDWAKSKTRDSS